MTKSNWQTRLLPFILVAYFAFSAAYVVFFYTQIRSTALPAVPAEPSLRLDTSLVHSEETRKEMLMWKDRVALEVGVDHRRYAMLQTLVTARLKIVAFAFALGSICVLIGAFFVLARISEPASDVGIGTESLKARISSSSPGLILAFLGTVIILVSMLIKGGLSMNEEAEYIAPAGQAVNAAQK
jgi:nitrate reductase gamma subunit